MMGSAGYPDDPAMQDMIKRIREQAKGAKPNDIVFLNQGGPPFLVIEGELLAASLDGHVQVQSNKPFTKEDIERLKKAKKIQIEVFD